MRRAPKARVGTVRMLRALVFLAFAFLNFVQCSESKEHENNLEENNSEKLPMVKTPPVHLRRQPSPAFLIRKALIFKRPEDISKILEENSNIEIFEPIYGNKDLIDVVYRFRQSNPDLFPKIFELSGFDVNRLRYDGTAVLHFLIREGDIEMLEILFKRFKDEIDSNLLSSFGLLPLEFALDDEEVFEFVLENAPGLLVSAPNAYGSSILGSFRRLQDRKLIEKVIEHLLK